MIGRRLESVLDGFRRQLAEFLEIDANESDRRAARELRDQLDDWRARLGGALAAQRNLERDGSFDEAAFNAGAEKAIRTGREDLARALLQSKAKIAMRAREIEAELAALERHAQAAARLASPAEEAPAPDANVSAHIKRITELLGEIEGLDER